jgi:hypothetical protein
MKHWPEFQLLIFIHSKNIQGFQDFSNALYTYIRLSLAKEFEWGLQFTELLVIITIVITFFPVITIIMESWNWENIFNKRSIPT